jgi:hypothetical protein
MECKVLQVIQTGDQGAAGNLVICQVLLMHVKEEILDDDGRIDPFKLDAVARLGGDWYCRVQGNAIFKVPKPLEKIGVGFDRIPEAIRNSKILTGNDLGMLANVENIPDVAGADAFANDNRVHAAWQKGRDAIHKLAQEHLMEGKVMDAWRVLLYDGDAR